MQLGRLRMTCVRGNPYELRNTNVHYGQLHYPAFRIGTLVHRVSLDLGHAALQQLPDERLPDPSIGTRQQDHGIFDLHNDLLRKLAKQRLIRGGGFSFRAPR